MGNYNSDKKNARFFGLKLSINTDADIIDRLESQESVQTYIKALIRADIMKGEKTMNTYKIKPEYLDLWEGGETPSDPDRIITQDELESLAADWEKPVEELLEQLILQEDVTLTGYNPAGRPVTITLEDGHVMIHTGDETVQWNDEYYDEEQLFGTVRSSLIREGYSF